MTDSRPNLAVRLATCGPVGYAPVAPGTAGSLVGVALVAAIGRLPAEGWVLSSLLAVLVAATFLAGAWAAARAEKFFGRTDPGQVVIDEVAGQMTTFLLWPGASFAWLIAGFVLFRAFDVLKPFPAGRAERVPGGWGIMLDDLVAGGYSLAVMAGLRFWWN